MTVGQIYPGEIVRILDNEVISRETIKQLENELGVYKRAYAGLEAERIRNEQLIQDSQKKREDLEKCRDDLESQLKVAS